MKPEWREAAAEHFARRRAPDRADEVAAYYRERRMAAVDFIVDAEATGRPRPPNEEIAELAAANADVLIPFASVDRSRPGRASSGRSG